MMSTRITAAGCMMGRSIRQWALLCCTVLTPALCFGQLDLFPGAAKTGSPGKPKFATTIAPAAAAPGEEVTLSISVKLPKGYYIYATSGDFGGRTKIETNPVGLEAVDSEFVPKDAAKEVFDTALNVTVGKHHDEATWTRKYRVLPGATTAKISGKLTGMYCSGADAEVGQCVPIQPPYEFTADVQVASAAAVTAPQRLYAQHIQPTKKNKKSGEETPLPIAWDFALSPTNAGPGDKVTLSVKATLKDGWHTFSLTQPDGAGGSPTQFALSKISGLKEAGEGFVADRPFEIEEQAGLKLEVHNHEVTWSRDFVVLPDVKPGEYGVGGKAIYQYCSNVCVQGQTPFVLGAVDEPAPRPAQQPPALEAQQPGANEVPAAAPAVVAVDNPGEAQAKQAPEGQRQSLFAFLLVCLGGGFLALLTPCSFPMVPITVSFFLKQSESQHKRPWLLALVYCGTIVAAFTILGVGIAFVFGAAKLNELANIAWLNLVIGTVFLLFALNMLGMFEIRVPGWLLTMTASKESAGSYFGAIFMALTFTLTSFTCTFAIAGSLLVIASRGEIYRPVLGMLAFGTAFAAPFFVLAMVPGLLKKLPKSGGWMNSVKVVMGLLELGAAVKFFSIADPGQVVFDHVLVMLIWLVLASVTAGYLFGWFRLPHDTVAEHISPWRMLLGTSFLILAGLLTTGVVFPDRGGFAVRQILAFAPAKIEGGNGPMGPSLIHHGLEFALYVDKAIPVAQKQNRPLLLDFTGVNCANCRDMELLMGQTAWKQRIEKFVGVQLYVDVPQIPTIADAAEGERLQKENVDLQLKLLGDVTMPHYAVVTPDGQTVLSTFLGKETIPGSFVQFLDDGWTKWEQLQKGGRAVGQALEPAGKQVSR